MELFFWFGFILEESSYEFLKDFGGFLGKKKKKRHSGENQEGFVRRAFFIERKCQCSYTVQCNTLLNKTTHLWNDNVYEKQKVQSKKYMVLAHKNSCAEDNNF